MRTIAIGLLGAGNVGAGTLRILAENRDAIRRRLNATVLVKKVLVRSPERARHFSVDPGLLTTRASDVIDDPDIRVVVELIGGIEPARTLVLSALRAGKHVVTANKALLAAHGREIFREAAVRGLRVYFEGSVAGGIPVLRSLREGLASDQIESLCGIVNGTSNFVLDGMTTGGLDYERALAQAQAAGLAEADPTLDVCGMDAAHKLALLALVSFGLRVDPERIPTEGITRVRAFDVRAAGSLGYVVKSLAIAKYGAGRLQLRVHPTLVPKDHVLASVHGAYNAVMVGSRALGRSMYYGRGAGMMPTGTAVVSDLVEVCRTVIAFADSGPPPEAFSTIDEADPAPLDDVDGESYLCVHVPNLPGILGRVAGCLGGHGVSIKQVNQETRGRGDPVELVIVTERALEKDLVAAIAEVDSFEEVREPTHRIRILDPEPED